MRDTRRQRTLEKLEVSGFPWQEQLSTLVTVEIINFKHSPTPKKLTQIPPLRNSRKRGA